MNLMLSLIHKIPTLGPLIYHIWDQIMHHRKTKYFQHVVLESAEKFK